MDKVNILVVDDRPEGILAVQAVLSSPGYNIVTAASGNEALRHLLRDDFAVILLDVQMPIMNGFETASVVKTREKSRDIPIIFMSAINQDEQYVYQGYGVGAIDYLLKPFDPYILRSKVAIFVDIFKKKILIKEQALKLYENEVKAHAASKDKLELENLRRYQNLADSIPQIVFRLFKDGSFDYFNKVWFEYTGLTLETSSGLKWKDVIHRSDLPGLMELLEHKSNENGLECECRILSKHGPFRWHLIRIQPETFDKPGVVVSWLGTATDIEDRRKMEDTQRFLAQAGELLVSSLDYRMTLQSISKLAIPYLCDWCSFDVINEDGNLENLVINHHDPKKLDTARKLHDEYLCSSSTLVGAGYVIQTGQTQVYQNINSATQGDLAEDQSQIRLARELGDATAMIIPLVVHGKVLGAVTFASSGPGRNYDKHWVDIAEELGRRTSLAMENSKLYKLSQKAIEVRNDFLSIASHELNTPITSLKLQLQMVKKTLSLSKNGEFPLDRFSRSIDASVKQVDRLIALIQVLLDVSRIQSGKFTFNFSEFNVAELMNEIVDRHQEIINSSDCQLEVEVSGDLTAVWDKTRIEQVVINLLTNAIKYAPGKIKLKVKQEVDIIQIIVRDFGQGIPKDKLLIIFDRFERVTSNESVSGLGLGLFIVKQIVEGHHGFIDVTSDEKDGTCFAISIPMDATVQRNLQHSHLAGQSEEISVL
ncbi:MAG TPA: ATP-binding protein [Bacteriovoracaceae bacterium]|nr:ATP-binding protein [Bacteriovoracaceae bacterium]